MGKSKELATLTDVGGTIDGALTITETSNQALNLTTTGLGSQVVYQSSTTNTPWYTGVAGNAADDFLIYQGATANAGDIYMYTNSYERMRIDASGRVTMPYQPMFSAYDAIGATASYITFANTRRNIGNHFNASTGTFTAPIAGSYLFCWNGLHNNSYTTHARVLFAVNNSASVSWGDTLQSVAGSFTETGLSQIIYLAANDTVRLYNEANAVYGPQYAAFTGILVG